MIALRCSGLPLLFACPQSANDSLRVGTVNEAANVGSACHEAMTSIVFGYDPGLDGISDRWTVDRDELGRLAWYGRKAWAELAPGFAAPESEVSVALAGDGFDLTGHIDLQGGDDGRSVAILDWKTGRLDGDYYHQLAGYAACKILGEGYEEVRASVIWLRDQDVETYVFTRRDIEAWILRLVSVLSQRTGEYRLGGQCGYCPRSHSCPAVKAAARASIAVFQGSDLAAEAVGATLDGLAPAQRVALYRQAKLLERLTAGALSAIRLNVIQSGGVLDGGDGTELRIVEENGRREIDTLKAWPVLIRLLGDDQAADVISISPATP